jgi:ubiquinone/menaquinone biosynthesis C-methylase UbiE
MELFDRKAETYDEFCQTPIGKFVNDIEHNIISSLAAPMPGEHAVDLGCGTGAYTAWLGTLGVHATGVDVSERMLTVARRKHKNSDMFLHADLRQLPFENESFDLAIANVVLEFVSEPELVLGETRRILRPGGRLIVGFIGRSSAWGQKYIERGQANPVSVYRDARFFTYSEASSIGWKQPSTARFGLYVGPHEFIDERSAWKMETSRGMNQMHESAGFFGLRWDR